MEQKLGIKLDTNSNGRRFAIGDIHGCFNTFESLLEDKLRVTKQDQIFLLGDYIDRGKRNREVLDYILELQEEKYQIYPLMGNHEYFILRDTNFIKTSKIKPKIKDLIESKDLLNHHGEIEEKYFDFISQLPYYYELDKFILVHAGLDFENDNPLIDKASMIYARNYKVNKDKLKGKTLIHGHTPINIKNIKIQILNYLDIGHINLDNGCVYKHYEMKDDKDLGRLCALNLDTMDLIYLDNID